MISVNNLRQGAFFKQAGNIFQVICFSHIKIGRGGAIVKTKIKNLITGSLTEKSFKATDSVEEAAVDRKKGQFLYSDDKNCFFMDEVNFEQFEVPKTTIGPAIKFLKEALTVQLIIFEDQVINIELPIKEVYKVTATDPGLKGDTVSGGSKPAQIETGATILVPLFIKIGDNIRVNTLEGTYVERSN